MNIKTKFDLNDTVYALYSKNHTTETPCPHCKGTGKWTIKEVDHQIDCEECWGHKVISVIDHNIKVWDVCSNPYIVKSIICDKDGVKYALADASDPHEHWDRTKSSEHNLTHLKHEAILLCESRNSASIPKTKTRKEKRKQKHAKK